MVQKISKGINFSMLTIMICFELFKRSRKKLILLPTMSTIEFSVSPRVLALSLSTPCSLGMRVSEIYEEMICELVFVTSPEIR